MRLIIQKGARKGEIMDIKGAAYTIGSSSDNSIQLPDADIQPRHARLSYDAARKAFIIVSLAGDGKVMVNDKPITSRQLKPGDMITIGPAVLSFDFPPSQKTSSSGQTIPVARKTSAVQGAEKAYRVSGTASGGGFDLNEILATAVSKKASDIHLTVGSPPAMRVDGEISFLGSDTLKAEDTYRFLDTLLTPGQKKAFLEKGDTDLAHSVPGLGRFRVNILTQRGSVGVVCRHVAGKILPFDQLNLPPVIETIANFRRGLILVTGTTGSGKSTTLASIVDYINARRSEHIITLEDPIEFLHKNKKSIVTQREILIDTKDFASALRAAMREDPDTILVGEMRDAETFQAAIAASETGHLVFSTLHTTNVMLTIDRIVDLFPSNMHEQVRSSLSLQLQSIISQRLVPKIDGKGRVPALEVLLVNPAVRALIKENNVRLIPNAINSGKEQGMQTFNTSLVKHVNDGLVSREDALSFSDNPEELTMNLQGIYLASSKGGILKKR